MKSPFDYGKRVLMWMISGVTILSGYGFAKLELFQEAHLLPLTAWDQAIPLVPWTVWIYGSGTVVCLLAWLAVPDRIAVRRLYFSLTMAAILCWVFFFLYPTTYPRHLWPTPEGSSATLRELADLRAADTPSNCFPSQHVALAWALALCWAEWTKYRWFRPVVIVWAVLVSLFTLTTKQHYIVDVPSGFLVGLVSWAVVRHQIRLPKRSVELTIEGDRDRQVLQGLLTRVRAHQWELSTLGFGNMTTALPNSMVDLISQTIWVEEIAGLNFQLLRRATEDPILTELYAIFEDEERRHAAGLRALLRSYGHTPRPPGLGASLVLDQFDTLDPCSPEDVVLVLVSTPVFETFLDAGTIPFLEAHPALHGAVFSELVARIDRDEGAHLAVNWLMSRQASRRYSGLRGLRLLLNPNIYRGMLAVPWLSLETYARAYSLGFRFESLLPAFKKLWRHHKKAPEFRRFFVWQLYRLFVICGVIATVISSWLAGRNLLFIKLWLLVASGSSLSAKLLFGKALLRRRGLAERCL